MNIHVVLVRAESSGNIGAAARAMANMGAHRLILIDAQCELDSKARQMAAGAQEALSEVVQYSSWAEFYQSEREGLRIGMTRRAGRQRKVFPLEEMLQAELKREEQTTQEMYLIFGPEADGLNADDLALVHFACHLPIYGSFGSLNLAQAVLLALFMVRQKFPPEQIPNPLKGRVIEPAEAIYFPDGIVREWLTAIGFDIAARRASAYLTLRRLLLQNRPTRHEIQVLEAILQQNVRMLREGSLGLAAKDVADDLADVGVEDI